MKLGEVVVIHVYYNFTKFHQNRMKNKKVLLIARFSAQNFKVSVESWKSYILRGGWNFRKMVHMGFVDCRWPPREKYIPLCFSIFWYTVCNFKNVQMDAFDFGPKTSFHERISVFSQHSFHHFVKIQIFVQLFFYIS